MADLRLHCIHCGETLAVNHILYAREDPETQARRLAFELEHNARHNTEKSVGMILEIPEKTMVGE